MKESVLASKMLISYFWALNPVTDTCVKSLLVNLQVGTSTSKVSDYGRPPESIRGAELSHADGFRTHLPFSWYKELKCCLVLNE